MCPVQAAWLLDQGQPNGAAASIAKVFATEHANRCVAECVQVHGGMGFSNACVASRLYRDARITTIFEGTSEINRLIIARDLFARFARGVSD